MSLWKSSRRLEDFGDAKSRLVSRIARNVTFRLVGLRASKFLKVLEAQFETAKSGSFDNLLRFSMIVSTLGPLKAISNAFRTLPLIDETESEDESSPAISSKLAFMVSCVGESITDKRSRSCPRRCEGIKCVARPYSLPIS